MSFIGINGIVKAKASADWPSSPGQIVSSSVEGRSSTGDVGRSRTTYHADIVYEFLVGGMTFNGTRVAYGDYGSSSSSHSTRIVDRYPKGKSVTVYYMPENPEECLLEPGVHAQAWILPGLGLICFAAGGVMVYCCRLRKTGNNRDTSSQQISDNRAVFDPTQSDDPIALETQ